MSYIGSRVTNSSTTLARPRDEFECSGNEKAFKLSQVVPGAFESNVQVVLGNVIQEPVSAYTIQDVYRLTYSNLSLTTGASQPKRGDLLTQGANTFLVVDATTGILDVMAATAGGAAPTTGSGLTLNVPNIDFGIDEQVKHNDDTISYTTGTITGISIVQGGGSGYTTDDTIFIGAPNIGGNERATATVSVSATGVIQSITVTNAGKGYVTPPAVTITSSGSGTNATATATLNSDGGVESIAVDSGGSGYDFISTTITIENATSGGRQATASITSVDGSGAVTGVSLTDAGTGYTAKPLVGVTTGGAATSTGTGTIAMAGNTTTVTGTGTAFTSQLTVGQALFVGESTLGFIDAIASDTSLTLKTTVTQAVADTGFSFATRAELDLTFVGDEATLQVDAVETLVSQGLYFNGVPRPGENLYIKHEGGSSFQQVPAAGSVTEDSLSTNLKSFTVDKFTTSGASTSTFTLSKTPASGNAILVVINGSVQTETTHYSVSGTTLTLVTPLSAGVTVTVVHLGFGTVSRNAFVDGTLTASAFTDLSMTGNKIANNTLDGTKLANGAVVAHLGFNPVASNAGTAQSIDSELSLSAALNMSAAGSGQIRFPATQNNSTNAETLDDYRESSLATVLGFGGNQVSMNMGATAVNTTYFTKVGNIVMLNMEMTLTAKGSSTGNAEIVLPIVADASGDAIIPIWFENMASGLTSMIGRIEGGSQALKLFKRDTDGEYTACTEADFTNTSHLIGSGTYRSAT